MKNEEVDVVTRNKSLYTVDYVVIIAYFVYNDRNMGEEICYLIIFLEDEQLS